MSVTDNKTRKEVRTKAQPICWVNDYEKEINISASGRYHLRYDEAGKANEIANDYTRYKIYLPTKSETGVVVEVRFRVRPMVDAIQDLNESADMLNPAVIKARAGRAAKVEKVKAACVRGVESHWNNKFKLKIEDPICGSKIIPITYKIIWVESDDHYEFRVYGNYQREQVEENVVYVGLATEDLTFAHEFAHCLGVPDEYSYNTKKEEQVRYFKPDGTLGEIIVGTPDGIERNKVHPSIMNGDSNAEVRHCWFIAIEAQALLSDKIGRKIKCDILPA